MLEVNLNGEENTHISHAKLGDALNVWSFDMLVT